MRHHSRHLALAVLLVLGATACSSAPEQYQIVPLYEIKTVRTETGEVLALKDEKYIAFHEDIERSPNVRSATRVTNSQGREQPGDFTVSPDGSVVVYQARDLTTLPRHSNLWRVSTAGSGGKTRLTAGNYFDTDPFFSVEGKEIYFASNRITKYPKIWRVKADGAGGIACITLGTAMDRWPCPATNGKEVFFTSRPLNASSNQIWKIGSGGNLPTQLKEGWRPRCARDGNKVVYCSKDPNTGKSKIWVMNVDSTNPTQLSSDPDFDERQPSWSADGRRIVFASDAGKDSNGKRNFDIWVMSADGSGRQLLTTNGSTDLMPQFSPDGRYIYFLSNRAFTWDIWRIEIANSM